MLRTLLSAAALLLAVALLWLAVVVSGWLPRPAPGDAESAAALHAARDSVGGRRNAFALLYSFARDVPESQWESVAAADAETYRRERHHADLTLSVDAFPAYPGLAGDHPGVCNAWVPDCLPRVRAHLAELRPLVAVGAAQLARGDRLGEYDHYRYGMWMRYDSPLGIGMGNYFPLLFTSVAIDHLDGRTDQALGRLCGAATAWRRLRGNTDMLIVDMLGVAALAGASRLYAEIAADLPGGVEPPCDEVFAPLADREFNQCAVFGNEFAMIENSMNDVVATTLANDSTRSWFEGQVIDLTVNRAHALRLAARALGRYCQPIHRERIAARSTTPLPETRGCSVFDHLVDPVGCHIAGTEVPAYDDYYTRVLDLDGRLRLLQLALRLGAAADPAAAFDARPPELDSPIHAFAHDRAEALVRMRPIDQKRGETWAFAYRRAAAPGGD
jgi:hypothetical protein